MKLVQAGFCTALVLFLVASAARADDKLPQKLTIKQRGTEKISAFNGDLALSLGDITAGQVPLKVEDIKKKKSLRDPISLKKFGKTDFEYKGKKYFVQIVEMRNFLFGSDDNVDILVADNEGDLAIPAAENPQVVIQSLIGRVEKSGLTFVRNGEEHGAGDAAKHLSGKYERLKSEIATPEDFISKAATKSSISGETYLVKMQDGTLKELSDWLKSELQSVRDAAL